MTNLQVAQKSGLTGSATRNWRKLEKAALRGEYTGARPV
jgi:hypothetical protein